MLEDVLYNFTIRKMTTAGTRETFLMGIKLSKHLCTGLIQICLSNYSQKHSYIVEIIYVVLMNVCTVSTFRNLLDKYVLCFLMVR